MADLDRDGAVGGGSEGQDGTGREAHASAVPAWFVGDMAYLAALDGDVSLLEESRAVLAGVGVNVDRAVAIVREHGLDKGLREREAVAQIEALPPDRMHPLDRDVKRASVEMLNGSVQEVYIFDIQPGRLVVVEFGDFPQDYSRGLRVKARNIRLCEVKRIF